MTQLHWELSVLSRAVAYQNLSGAAVHVGLSQPQLSRIVARLEAELGMVLLDRSAKRKSGWTPVAFRLAELYSNTTRKLDSEIHKLVVDSEPAQLKVGTLEGVISIAVDFSHHMMKMPSLKVIELHTHDLNRLEELFFDGEFDVVFSAREPGRRKFKHSREIGFQSLEKLEAPAGAKDPIHVFSSFEYGTRLGLPSSRELVTRSFVSNSLEARKVWFENYGGIGQIPSQVHKQRGKKTDEAVFMIASDQLTPNMLERINAFKY